jgi:mono/diheme cytochrome c family protein
MKKNYGYFISLNLILLILTGIVIYREANPGWKIYQKAYFESLGEKAYSVNNGSGSSIDYNIILDWNPELGVQDRCRTCHIGVENQEASENPIPINTHPDISPHEFSRFGCSICHGGNGFATRLPDAHKDLLPLKLIEGSCGRCHRSENFSEALTLSAGLRLMREYRCEGCHEITRGKRLENPAPDLSGIGSKVNPLWLVKWLKRPRDYLPTARMPDFLLSEDEIYAITDYLTGLKEGVLERGDISFDVTHGEGESDKMIEQGEVLFRRHRCLSCHSMRGRGGTLGPDLGRIAEKVSKSWMFMWLKEPHKYDSTTLMPAYNLTERELRNIVEYLFDETSPDDEERMEVDEVGKRRKPAPAWGKKLIIDKGCYNCHRIPGITGPADFAPALSDIADRKIERIDLGRSGIPKTMPDYIAAKLQNPRIFGSDLKMPFFGFSLWEVGQIVTALMSRTVTVPADYKRYYSFKEDIKPSGRIRYLFERYRCFACHRIGGRGGDLGPDLTYEGSKVRRGWLVEYLKRPYAIRPFLTERMPRFNLTDDEAGYIADYIKMVLVSDELYALSSDIEPGNPSTGKRLYYEKYACQACHTTGREGGYFGPVLDNVSARLTSGWIFFRMKDAHKYESGAREPVLDISDNDRRDILSYLLTLKNKS